MKPSTATASSDSPPAAAVPSLNGEAGGPSSALAVRPAVAAGLCLVLAAVTLAIYSRALTNDFAELDDNAYVTRNEHVQQGITVESLRWVATATVGGNWHPLTMLSHMVDCHLYGLAAWGHHLSGILWHAANVGLCGWLWWRMTGQLGPSLAAAALFGWHPLRVESVAWVAERKDVLSTFFGLLAILAYVHWFDRRGVLRYLLVVVWMLLSLLAKPMLVTLPCMLLLLDFWPLQRLSGQGGAGWDLSCAGKLVLEKAPLFALSVAFCLVTFATQSESGVRSLENLPVFWRLANTLVVYAEYLGQTLWPANLAIFYPHPANLLPLDYAALAAATLALFTWQVWRHRESFPSLPVGWLWYLGTLVPVIGLVQVGGAARADRYTYVPSIGIAAGAAFAAAAWSREKTGRQRLLLSALAIWLTVQAGLTWRQIGFWKNPTVLFERAVAVTGRNFFAQYVLGTLKMDQKDYLGAVQRFDKSLEAKEDYGEALLGKAYCQRKAGKLEEARQTYLTAVRMNKGTPALRLDFAYVLLRLGKFPEAERQFNELLREYPGMAEAMIGQGLVYARRGRPVEAIQWYVQAKNADPDNVVATDRWARLMGLHPDAKLRRPQEALAAIELLCHGTGARDARLWDTWALLLGAAGQFSKAVETAEAARNLAEESPDAEQRSLLLRAIDEHLAQLRRRQAVWENPAHADLPPGY